MQSGGVSSARERVPRWCRSLELPFWSDTRWVRVSLLISGRTGRNVPALCSFMELPRFPTARRDLPITLHVAQPDPIVPPDIVSSWASEARKAGLDPEIFYYRGAGHFYTDEAIPDFDPDAAQQTWERILHFLNNIEQA
jgi:dienelactone hydrolase